MLRSRLRSLWAGIAGRRRVEEAISDEIEFHIEARAQDLIALGMEREDALRQARLEFGSLDNYKEEIRQARGLRLFDELRADAKYAVRVLAKSPGFAFAAIATLALGIAANTAVFGLLNEVLLKKLPVKKPAELVQFDVLLNPLKPDMIASISGQGRRGAMTSFSYPTFVRFRDQNRTLSDVFAFSPIFRPLNVLVDNDAQIAQGQFVSGGYFTGLGVSAHIGRTIMPVDDNANAQPVAVISDAYWKARFAASPDVVGKTVAVNRVPFTIVGITPEDFYGTNVLDPPDFSLPMAMQAQINRDSSETGPWVWWIEMMGRAKPGIRREQVLADLQPLFEDTVRDSWDSRPQRYRTPSYNSRTAMPRLRVNDGSRGSYLFRSIDFGPMLSLFLAISALTLMAVCANVANLLLARASSRQQEMSVRLAIGAGRGRLIRQLLTESILLALAGGAVGVALAYYGRNFLTWLPSSGVLPTGFKPSIDWRVLAFTAGLSFLAGLLFGVFPGLRATKSDLSPAMRTNPNRGGSQRLLVSRSLMVAQVTVCLVLLVGAGLIIQSVRNLLAANVGFNAHNLVVFDIDSQLTKDNQAKTRQLYEAISERLEALPGVQSATFSGVRPIIGGGWWEFFIPDQNRDGSSETQVFMQNVRRNFLNTMEMPLLRGRGFTADEEANGSSVAIINETAARALFKDGDPIGRQLRYSENGGQQDHPAFEVIGVVRDAKYGRIEEADPAIAYVPFSQGASGATFEVRTAADPRSLMPAMRAAVRDIDPNLPLRGLETQEDQIRDYIGMYRMFAVFTAVFGAFAVLLACIGLYGIVAYSVTRRINEIGIRMALGAARSDVIGLIMRGTYVVAGLGLVLGIGIALAVTHLISGGLLYGVTPYDPVTFVASAAIIAAVCAFAAYLPARRAARVDPMIALRYE
jgi:predicted permease